MTTPIFFEPADPEDLPLVAVTRHQWAAIAGTLGVCHVELGNGEAALVFNGRQYVMCLDGAA